MNLYQQAGMYIACMIAIFIDAFLKLMYTVTRLLAVQR